MNGALAGKTVTDIDSGYYFACAVADGKPYCWGENVDGQLGNNSTTDSNEPVAVNTAGVLNGKTVTKVSAGFHHACAIADGQAYCWGAGTYGALGHSSTSNSLVPVAVNTAGVLNGKTVTDITVGERFTCVIAANLPYCWGYGLYNRLGRGSSTANTSVPVALEIASGSWTGKTLSHISVGESHGCLLASNVPYCWGNNWGGQIGNNSTATAIRAVPITTGALSGKTVTDINTGVYHSCAIANGQQYCWGYNGTGQLGDGSATDRLVPTAMATGVMNGKTVTGLGGGSYEHSCSIADDAIYCTGENYEGSLGSGNNTYSEVHVATVMTSFQLLSTQVLFGSTSSENVNFISSTELSVVTPAHSAGTVNVTVINPNGESVVYSNGYTYQDSTPTLTSIAPSSGPLTGGTNVTISGNNFSLARVSQVSDGVNTTSCALATNYDIYCWGDNWTGQLGDGTTVANSNTPVKVKMDGVLAGKTVASIDAGFYFNCAVADGKPYCWGYNDQGQLGNNSTIASNEPVAVDTSDVLNGKTVTKVSAGFYHACAIADGQAYCWGDNSYGGLGNNSTTDSPVPVAVDTSGVLSGKTVTDISVGEYFTCAVADGLPYCWGYGLWNRLGRGTSEANTSVPVANEIASGSWSGKTVTDISVGQAHGCLIASSIAYCWGDNWAGRVGNNSSVNAVRTVPVYADGVLSGKTVTDIATGVFHSCVIANGQQYCWGHNGNGKLGDGTATDRSIPTAMTTSDLTGKTVTGLGGGSYEHTCTIADDSLYCTGYNGEGALGNGNYSNSTSHISTVMTSFSYNPPQIYIGNQLASNINYVSSTQLTASTPATAAPGHVDVKLQNARGQTATIVNGYEYLAIAPQAPTNLATTPSQNGVALTWTAPTNNGGATITNYQVEYSSNGGSSWSTFSHPPSAATNITVTGLTVGTTYTFRVRAINSAGTSSPSSTATGTPVYVTLQSNSDISINITPNGSTTVSSNKHTLSLNTNNPSGFQITIEMSAGTRNLVNGAHSISPSNGSLASPTSLLVNTWGYRIDSIGGFGNGPTVAETNVNSSGYSWAGVPANGNPTTIKSSATPQLNNTTTVWYGLNASNTKASGSYTGTVLYTAIAG